MARVVGDLKMSHSADEDRILRVWTPMLLRTILIVATAILILGLGLAIRSPDAYVTRYRSIEAGHFHPPETLRQEFSASMRGNPHSVMTVGLLVLTLVPLGRVAFCFLFFLKERDYAYVGFTAYVLIGLLVGIMLGNIG